MPGHCWDNWIPGVLTKRQLGTLCREEVLRNAQLDAIDQSSIDLSVGDEAYKLKAGSVKPSGDQYLRRIRETGLVDRLEAETDGGYVLEPRNTYLFKLRESLYTGVLRDSPLHGQATAKSSIGRVDVLARLIVDGMDTYEEFNPAGLTVSTGEMFLEISPMTFPVRVKSGIRLTQLRLICGQPEDVEITGTQVYGTLLKNAPKKDGSLSVDLANTAQIAGRMVAAFKAKRGPGHKPICLWKNPLDLPNPVNYWTTEVSDEKTGRFKIAPDEFYIFRSSERITVPKGIAVYCRAIDETIGEIRIHYAGFVHPFFGTGRADGLEGTPLIFEVRGHGISVNLRDKEKLARLTFYRMSEDADEEGLPAAAVDDYMNQELQLSKFFGAWT